MNTSLDNHRPSIATVHRVWAELTREPHATVRELAARVGRSASVVNGAILVLVEAGYVEYAPRRPRARRVVVPFHCIARATGARVSEGAQKPSTHFSRGIHEGHHER